MAQDWTAEAVGRMHTARITGRALAKECGYSEAYVSEVLNGRRGTEKTKEKLLAALARLEGKAPQSMAARIERLDDVDRAKLEGYIAGLLAQEKYAPHGKK